MKSDKKKIEIMSPVRTQGSCVGVSVRTSSPPSPSVLRCSLANSSADDATCGAPVWMGKGLTCVCFKRKGTYERICFNLTPLQARFFFFLRIIVRKKIVNCVELDITCLALMIIAYTVWFEPAMSGFSTSMDAKRYG